MSRRLPLAAGAGDLLRSLWESLQDDLFFILIASAMAVIRAMGVQINSGETGLLFSFGRAKRTLDPGFYPLIPFLQFARRLPTRSRTLDLPEQRVVNREELVYHVDATLVYQVVDVRKALIEIDDLVKGMRQMLGLGVQEVLRETTRISIQETRALNAALAQNLARRLEPWGVHVERAGFVSIAPSTRTLRITQFGQVTRRRLFALDVLRQHDLRGRSSLGLIGTRARVQPHGEGLRRTELDHRRVQSLRRRLMREGWSADDVRRAERRLFSGGGIAERSAEAARGRERDARRSTKAGERQTQAKPAGRSGTRAS